MSSLIFNPVEGGPLQVIGSIPCALCQQPMTQADADNWQMVAIVGKETTVTHLGHFYTRNPVDGKFDETADHNENMQRLALVYSINEGFQRPNWG